MQVDTDGKRSGFFIALAEAISREIDVPIEFLDVPEIQGVAQAQISGRSHMVAGIVELAPMVETHVYSKPVAADVLRFATLVENAAALESGPVAGLRIGIVPPILGSEEPILAENVAVPFVNVEAALVGLLKDEVDALLIPPPTVFRLARDAGVDGRIVFAGRPVRELQRYVALNKTRADLLPAVNAAIDRLEETGDLALLRQRYSIDVPPPEPEILKLPMAHAPPFGIISADGQSSGYAADLFVALAQRAGLRFEFETVTLDVYSAATKTREYDVIPFLLASGGLGPDLDITIPIDSAELGILVRPDETRFEDWTALADARVGSLPGTTRLAHAKGFPASEVRSYGTTDALEKALRDGEVDAIMAVEHILHDSGLFARYRSIGRPDFTATTVIGLRPGLGAARERLNAVIPGYLLSEDYAALRQRYFAPKVFWTPARLLYALAIALGGLLVMAGFQVRDRLRQRRIVFEQQAQDLAREQAHAGELQIIVNQLEQANREQAEFTYAVSHDLKSPANTIGMLIDALTEDAQLDDDSRALLDDMARTNTHMRQLVDDVLAYSRVVDEAMVIEPVDLDQMLRDIQGDLKGAIVAAGAALEVPSMPVIQGSRMQLRMLFQNLLSNAIKFRRPDRAPLIRVLVDAGPDALTITVADNGIGIPEKHREKVFGLFQRLNSQSAYEGTGLGLTICKRVMSNHRGDIRIGPGIDGGTAFYLIFPKEGR